ncbi:MAG: 5'/3'-nucleotidase SurE [Clostridia bacterium]
MKLILTNDDGIYAPGIIALARELQKEHDITIVAPSMQQSGTSHSITFIAPLRVNKVKINGLEGVSCYSVDGSPADCVKFAYGNLNIKQDIVISGINIGSNLGTDVFYSGTVSAAMEGALNGIPSIAVSCCSFTPKYLDTAALYAKYAIEVVLKEDYKVININVPDLPAAQIRGIKYTKLCSPSYETRYTECTDPHGMKYYWIPPALPSQFGPEDDNDGRWVEEGYVAITPLLTDLTDFSRVKR